MEEPPVLPAPAEPPRHVRDWFGMIVSVAALLTSAVSIVLAVQNSDSMNRLVQANSWPYLQFTTGNVGDDGSRVITAALSNAGIGPLKIESFVISYSGEEAGDILALLRACCLAEGAAIETGAQFSAEVGEVVTANPTGVVLRPGDELVVFSLPLAGADPDVWAKLDSARFEIDLRACYCSVFDECWTTDFSSVKKTPAKVCRPEANSWNG